MLGVSTLWKESYVCHAHLIYVYVNKTADRKWLQKLRSNFVSWLCQIFSRVYIMIEVLKQNHTSIWRFHFRLFSKVLKPEETCETLYSDQQVMTLHAVMQVLGLKSDHRVTFAAVFSSIMHAIL